MDQAPGPRCFGRADQLTDLVNSAHHDPAGGQGLDTFEIRLRDRPCAMRHERDCPGRQKHPVNAARRLRSDSAGDRGRRTPRDAVPGPPERAAGSKFDDQPVRSTLQSLRCLVRPGGHSAGPTSETRRASCLTLRASARRAPCFRGTDLPRLRAMPTCRLDLGFAAAATLPRFVSRRQMARRDPLRVGMPSAAHRAPGNADLLGSGSGMTKSCGPRDRRGDRRVAEVGLAVTDERINRFLADDGACSLRRMSKNVPQRPNFYQKDIVLREVETHNSQKTL